MLGFFKYAHTYTSTQMHILSLHICIDNIDYFSLSIHFIHTDDSVSVTLQCLHKTITFYWRFKCTFSDTEFLETYKIQFVRS